MFASQAGSGSVDRQRGTSAVSAADRSAASRRSEFMAAIHPARAVCPPKSLVLLWAYRGLLSVAGKSIMHCWATSRRSAAKLVVSALLKVR